MPQWFGRAAATLRRQRVRCPVCHSQTTQQVATNVLHNDEPCPVYECPACSHKFCAPLPSPEVMKSWYQGMNYFHQNCHHQGITSINHSPEWEAFLDARQRVFDAHVAPKFDRGKNLVVGEIGCLAGAFLKRLASQGHKVIGFETNVAVAREASACHDIEIRGCDFEAEEIELNTDVVLSFHTFEHLRDPMKVTRKTHDMLNAGGVLLIEVPCDDDEMNNPDHLHFFNQRSLGRMMQPYFQEIQIVPNSYMRDGRYVLGSLYAIGRKAKSPKRWTALFG